jgi:hypothetical protein
MCMVMLRRMLALNLNPVGVIIADDHDGLQEDRAVTATILVERCVHIDIVLLTNVSVGAGLPGYASRGTAALISTNGADAGGAKRTAAAERSAACGIAGQAG